MADLALALVTHNATPWLAAFFASWQAAAHAAGESPPIYVADSGSTDDTRRAVQRLAPAAHVMECGDIGYGAAANCVLRAASEPWLLLCNPDLTFPQNFVTRMCEVIAADDGAAIYAPRLVNPDGSLQSSVGRFPTIAGLLADQFRPRPQRKYLSPQPALRTDIDWAMAACLLLHRQRVMQVAGFDEQFFLYVEEVDLFRRLRTQGCRSVFIPDWHLTHHAPNAARPPRKQVQTYAARGLLRYFARHGTAAQLGLYRMLGLFSGRLTLRETTASREAILQRSTRA